MCPFSWRREWPWILALASIGVTTRVFIARHPGAFLAGGDPGIFGLMAKHIWLGDARPLFGWGQPYAGSLATYVMAPFYGLLGADFTGVLAAHAVLFALSAPVFYRLLYEIGGRWGATAGMVALGLGTRALLSTSAMLGCFDIMPVAALLFLWLDRALRRGFTNLDAFAVGLLASGGYWVHPMFVSSIAATAIALLVASPLRTALGTDALPRALGPRRARAFRTGVLGGVALCVLLLALTVAGPIELDVLGRTISLTRAPRHATHVGLAVAAVWCAVELWISTRRCALVAAAIGVALAQVPLAAYRLMDGERLHHVPFLFGLEYLPRNAHDLPLRMADVLLGTSRDALPSLQGAGLVLAALAAGAALVATSTLLRIAHTTLCLRETRATIPAMLTIQAAVIVGAALVHEKVVEERYIVALWLPYVAFLAAVAGAAARRSRWAALAVIALVGGHYARDLAGTVDECRWNDVRLSYRELEVGMRRGRATTGYAYYTHAYLASYASDERVRLSSYGGWIPRSVAIREAAAAEPEPTAVFAANECGNLALLYEVYPHLVLDRWTYGTWTYVRVRRPPVRGGWLEELQGPPWRG